MKSAPPSLSSVLCLLSPVTLFFSGRFHLAFNTLPLSNDPARNRLSRFAGVTPTGNER